MREKGATERPQAFRYERAPDRYARMPCQYVRLPFHVERTSIRIERMSFRRGRIRGSFRFARDSFLINAISVPLCAISWDYSRSNICNARSIFVLTRNQSFNNGYYPSLQHSHWLYLVGEESVNFAVGLIDGHIGQRARLSASTVSGLSLVIRQMVAVSKPIAMHSRALLIFASCLPSMIPSALASVRSEM